MRIADTFECRVDQFTDRGPVPAVRHRIAGSRSHPTENLSAHLELAIDENTLSWQPGDSLGVVVNNDPGLVSELLNRSGINPEDEVVLESQSMTIKDALRKRLELTLLNPRVLARYAEVARDDKLDELVQSERSEQQAWFEAHQLIDLVEQFPADFSAQSLADTLMPLTPRVYSIASSALDSPDEVHLTIALKQSAMRR